MARSITTLACLAAAVLLSGCTSVATDTIGRAAGSQFMQLPLGIGPRDDELKRSPCACIPIPLGQAHPT